MEIESIRHKALRAFAETGKAKGLDAQIVGRLAGMLTFLAEAGAIVDLDLEDYH